MARAGRRPRLRRARRRSPRRPRPTSPCSTPTTTRCCTAATCRPGSPRCAPRSGSPPPPATASCCARSSSRWPASTGWCSSSSSTSASAGSTPSTSSAAAPATSCCASSPPTSCGREVLTGPVEATALGNVLVQALALGELAGLDDAAPGGGALGRSHAASSRRRRRPGNETYQRFLEATGLAPRAPPARPSDATERTIRLTDTQSEYQPLARRLADSGHDVAAIERALAALRGRDAVVGLRRLGHALRRLPPAGPPARRVREDRRRRRGAPPDRHRPGRRPAFPVGRRGQPRASCPSSWRESGLRAGAVNPNLFQDPDYKLGSLTNPDPGIRRKAVEHLLGCVQIAAELGSTAQSLWLADGTNYAGQDDLRARRDRLEDGAGRVLRGPARPSRSCSSSTSSSSPPSTPPTSPTGARRCCCARRWVSERGCSSTSATTPRASTSSRSSRILAREGRLGGFHFNNRKYADDDLIVGSVNPLELFLIFAELGAGAAALPRLTIDQSHNIEAKVEAMVLSVVNLQESYAKSLLIDRAALDAGAARRRRAARPRAAARRLQHRRAPAVRQGPRGARRGGGPDRRAARLGLRASAWPQRAGAQRDRRAAARRAWGSRMSVASPIVATVADQWSDARRRAATTTLEEVLLASHLLGPTAPWPTSAAATPRPRAPPPITSAARCGRCGSRARAATWPRCRPRTSPRCGWTRSSRCCERDEMSDEDMVAHLARCQLDPAAPRSSIETLLHAFIPAAHVHHTHPDAINALACAADGQELIAECFGDERGLDPVHPPRLHAGQAGRRGGPRQPRPAAGGAGQARPGRVGRHRPRGLRADRGGVQPGRRAGQRPQRPGAALRRAGARRRAWRRGPRRDPAPRCCPRCAARCPARAPRSCSPTSRRRYASWWTPRSGRDDRHRRRRLPRSPGPHQARADVGAPTTRPATTSTRCAHRLADSAAEYRHSYEAYFARNASDGDVMSDPDPRVVADRERGHGDRRHHAQGGAHLPRPLSPRHRGDGGRERGLAVRLARPRPRASPSSTGRSSSTSSRWPRLRASSRARSRSSPAPPAASGAPSSAR